VTWGENSFGQLNAPSGTDFKAIGAGSFTGYAIHSDGSLAAWGFNQSGQLAIPSGNFTAVVSSVEMVAALRSDGSIASWVTSGPVPEGNDFTAVTVGRGFGIALRSNGTLVSWGDRNYYNSKGEMDVPAGNDFVAVDSGQYTSVALRSDGSLVAWGRNSSGECNVPPGNDFIAVSAGSTHSLALRENGTIVGWSYNRGGECDTPPGTFKAIFAGSSTASRSGRTGPLCMGIQRIHVRPTKVTGHDFIAIDGGGSNGLALRDLSGSPAPVAALTADVRSGQPGLTVNFTDLSTNTPTAWTWDFDNDGIVDSILEKPTHTYAAPGTYTVNLTVYNAAGQSTTVETDYITISSAVRAAMHRSRTSRQTSRAVTLPSRSRSPICRPTPDLLGLGLRGRRCRRLHRAEPHVHLYDRRHLHGQPHGRQCRRQRFRDKDGLYHRHRTGRNTAGARSHRSGAVTVRGYRRGRNAVNRYSL
jgi:PKD repeat protein